MKLKYIMMILTFMFILTGCEPKIKIATAASDFIHQDYRDIEHHLKEEGFHNIAYKELADLTSHTKEFDGQVTNITIDNREKFKANTSFHKDALVVIEYHSMKKIALPFTIAEIKDLEATHVQQRLQEQGFENVTMKEVYDLLPSADEKEFENELKINGQLITRLQDEYRCDSEIVIISHRQKINHQVELYVNFPSNLLFNKYDVEMYLNGDKFDLLHGEDKDYVLNLPTGDYQLDFKKVDDPKLEGQYCFHIDQDVSIALEIKSRLTYIDVNEKAFDTIVELEEDELLVNFTYDCFESQPYQEVVSYLHEQGFENVLSEPIYDIVWGMKQAERCEAVFVNGTTNYPMNSVVKKDAEILVRYHMPKNK